MAKKAYRVDIDYEKKEEQLFIYYYDEQECEKAKQLFLGELFKMSIMIKGSEKFQVLKKRAVKEIFNLGFPDLEEPEDPSVVELKCAD